METKLKFGKGNLKLDKNEHRIHTFSLPAGHACPFAQQCLAKVDRDTGKLIDGMETRFRCFSASQEAVYPSVRMARWHNFELLRKTGNVDEMVTLIEASLPAKATHVRVHVSGDFFSQMYFDAWRHVAIRNPGIVFYAYTKSLGYWVARLDRIPENFRLTASYGGRQDELIAQHGLKYAKVFASEEAVAEAGLESDHDDSHAVEGKESFGLVIHGTQPRGGARL